MKIKLLLVVCVLILSFGRSYAQPSSYYSIDNKKENWEDASSWTKEFSWMAAPPPSTTVQVGIRNYGYLTRNGDLTVTGGDGIIHVYDTLVITGNLYMSSGGSTAITVYNGGLLIVLGNFSATNNSTSLITVNSGGRAVVVGDYNQQQGGVTGNGPFYIYDDTPTFSWGAIVDGTSYNGSNGSTMGNLLEDEVDLANNDASLNNFMTTLGVTCGILQTIGTAQSICTGSTPSQLTGGSHTGTYQWQSSTTSATTGFSAAAGTNNTQNYSPAALTQNTWFRRTVTNAGCTNTSSAILVTINPVGTWTGASSAVWGTGSNWCGGSAPTLSTDAIIPTTVASGRYPSISNAANVKDLEIQTGATVTITSNTITIYGNLTKTGTFTANGGTVAFQGSTTQTVTGSANTFNNLTINSAGGVTFQQNIQVNDQFTMTAGTIDMSSNTITLGTAANNVANSGTLTYTAGKIINGSFKRWVNRNVIADGELRGFFPMGTSTNSRPLWIYFPANGDRPNPGGTITVSHTGASTTTSSLSVNDNGTNIVRRQNSYWSVSTGDGITSGTYIIKAGGTGFGTVNSTSHLRLMQSNSVVGTYSAATGNTGDFLAIRTALSLSNLTNNFYVGSTQNVTSLPITLASFNGEASGNSVNLQWSTATEKNSYSFIVERSANGRDFAEVGEVMAAGESNTLKSYNFRDITPSAGKNYYRLKSVDQDNTYDYSNVIVVHQESIENISVYPNPVADRTLTLRVNQDFNSSVKFDFCDVTGKVIFEEVSEEAEKLITLPDHVEAGIYLVKVISPENQSVIRVVVK